MRYHQFKPLVEGGNIFKAPNFSKEDPKMLTDRINKAEIIPTVEFLEVMTGLDIADNLLGSTGRVASSGDIDIAIDKNSVSKDDLMNKMIGQGVNPDHLQKTGDSVHYMSPIWGEGGEKTDRFVQVDFMFVPDVEFAKWSMSTAPDSTYKGVYLQKLRADLTRTANPDWKWNHFNGVLSRSDNSSVFGFDPDAIAKGLLGKEATRADLESVERVLHALKTNRTDINTQVRDAYRTTLAPRKPGEQPDPNAPVIDEMTQLELFKDRPKRKQLEIVADDVHRTLMDVGGWSLEDVLSLSAYDVSRRAKRLGVNPEYYLEYLGPLRQMALFRKDKK